MCLQDGKDTGDTDKEAYHFIAYVPFKGKVYELDGLKEGPIELGAAEGETGWLRVVGPAIQERIARYSTKEIRFNLMAIVRNCKDAAEEEVGVRQNRIAAIQAAIDGGGNTAESDALALHGQPFGLSTDAGALQAQLAEEAAALSECEAVINEEEAKFGRWKHENMRRRHNFIPFAIALLQALAKKGQLEPLMEKAATSTRGQEA